MRNSAVWNVLRKKPFRQLVLNPPAYLFACQFAAELKKRARPLDLPHLEQMLSAIRRNLVSPKRESYYRILTYLIGFYFIEKESVVLDVGAHAGYYALLYSSVAGKKGVVYTYEANPAVYEKLLAKRFAQSRCVVTKHCAVSNASGKSVTLAYDADDLASQCSTVEPELMEEGACLAEIKTERLDDLQETKRCSFLKIDVEGHESAVLEGALKLLKRDMPVIMFEYGHASNAVKTVLELGYHVYDLRDCTKVTGDFEFEGVTDLVAVPEHLKGEIELLEGVFYPT